MHNKQYRVAIIGAGAIVRYGHIPVFQGIPNVQVEAICDINEERVKELASEKGIPQTFTDYEEMLAQVQPDITVIATPNIFHKPMAMAALEAGSNVLCEKPLALSYADASQLIDTAKEKGLVLTVGTHYRWSEPMRACKKSVDAGFFGEIYAARTVWHRQAGIPGFGSWFTNKDLAGGGCLLDIGIHALDRAMFLMGYPKPLTVSGSVYSKLGPQGLGLGGWGADHHKPGEQTRFDVDDLSWATIRFENGATLQFQVAWATYQPEQFFVELHGTKGSAHVGDREKVELYTSMNGNLVNAEVVIPQDSVNSYQHLSNNLVRYLDGDPEAEIISPQESLRAVQIIEAIQLSSDRGREVVLE